jgi:ATP-dependent metalloprotease FtsH
VEQLSDIVNSTRKIQDTLLQSIFGQDQAVNSFVSGYFQSRMMELSRKGNTKPQATFLFAGPPGVGKTFLAEQAAAALGLPFRRFDMSEYADKEANIEFCGSDKVYKNGKAGNVTGFVEDNPRSVLLFDEIEKAHITVIHLFLQLLDAGRLRDNYTDNEVSFTQTILIFTTNAGKNLYTDPTVANLSLLPRKTVIKALSTDKDPASGIPLFPAAICSRFASGNVVMFNHLGAENLYTIADRELGNNLKGFSETTGIKAEVDPRVASAIMLAEGGKADARTVKGRANTFFHEEIYELFRLLSSSRYADTIKGLERIAITVDLDTASEDVKQLFINTKKPEVLIFAEGALQKTCISKLSPKVVCHATASIEEAKELLFNHDISIILCDVRCKEQEGSAEREVLNVEDVHSVGHDFLTYALARYSVPVYLLRQRSDEISNEEFLSFAKMGVRDVLTVGAERGAFAQQVLTDCDVAYQQNNMLALARGNKVLSYKTSQTISKNRKAATIHLFDFKLSLATDTEDSQSILDNVSKPDLRFDDVIGAEDAKDELKYFVSYLKDPVKYMRRGVRAPKGILLYGPPGTGKTLLAKAMAGESDVTFLTAEGNQFLKRFVGEGSEAVHALFRAARKYAPSILFIDEIDAIAKDRNASGPSDNSSDVLTAFLTEMDGFNTDTSKPVFVLAATNYEVEPGKGGKTIDAALLRRFDRRLYVDLPNKDERRRFLRIKAAKASGVELSDEQIENIAVRSTGMSLADLDSIFEMALRNAIRSEEGVVGDAAFEEAFEAFNSGERKQWDPETLTRTARHEAGHALLCWLAGEKPSYLTIVARGDHGGYMQHTDTEGKGVYLRSELRARIRTSLGGRAAEVVYYGPEDGISTGASGDLYSATKLAEQMICRYGMDPEIGLTYVDPASAVGEWATSIHTRIKSLLDSEMRRAVEAIEQNRRAIDAMVAALLAKNHLREEEIDAIFSANVKS